MVLTLCQNYELNGYCMYADCPKTHSSCITVNISGYNGLVDAANFIANRITRCNRYIYQGYCLNTNCPKNHQNAIKLDISNCQGLIEATNGGQSTSSSWASGNVSGEVTHLA